MVPLHEERDVPDFVAEDPGGSEHQFLGASVIAIGCKGANQRREDTRLEVDPWNIHHWSQLL